MARIAFFCIPAHGHTNPTLEVVRELTARGHEVLYYAYESFREKIQAAGAEFIPCDAYDAQLRLTKEEASRLGSDLVLSTRVLVDTTLSLDEMVCREMEQRRPDCIVADSMAVWGKAVARKLGIPFVCSTTTFAFNQKAAGTMERSFRDLLNMLLSLGKVQKQIRRLQRRGYPVKNILDIIASDNDTHTIVYTSSEFQPFAETFSDKYAFVGPSIRPAEEQVEKTEKPLIYISMGTVNNEKLPLYRSCMEALRDFPCQAILSVGDQVEPEAFGDLPEHIQVHQKVDQIAVLAQADAFLTHCGMNSVSEGLWFGVPLVLYPQTPEQTAVASRAEQLGAGLRLTETTPEAIRTAIHQVLTQPSYRQNAEKIGRTFRASPGPKGAADKIEQVIAIMSEK